MRSSSRAEPIPIACCLRAGAGSHSRCTSPSTALQPLSSLSENSFPAARYFSARCIAPDVTDVNDRVRDEWKADTTGYERVKAVLAQTTEPRTAGDLADQALVSEPTARKHLEELAELGVAEAARDSRAIRYRRSEEHVLNRRIGELRETHTRQELVEGIREMKQELQDLRESFDAESPEELAVRLDADDGAWAEVSRWRTTRKNLAIAQAALTYDEAHRLVEA